LNDYLSQPPVFKTQKRIIYELKEKYADFVKVFSIGKSFGGKDITALAIGEPRGANLFVGGVHGSEWLTVLIMLKFAEQVLKEEKESRRGKKKTVPSIVIVPCLNPDGTDIAIKGPAGAGRMCDFVASVWKDREQCWQANIRGVDINHNFNAGWQILRKLELKEGITGPGPTKYGGTAPFSEPESRAAANLCMELDISKVYAFHSQGEEIYYKYGARTPAKAKLIAQVLAQSCGYKIAETTGTASYGGLKDWFIETTGRPGFTFEIGRGKNPLPIEDFAPLYTRLEETLMLAMML